jgi:hypothetical protein
VSPLEVVAARVRALLEEVDPESLADVIVDTTDLDRPRLVRA